METKPVATKESIDKIQTDESFKALVYNKLITLFSDKTDTRDPIYKCAEATAYVALLKKENKDKTDSKAQTPFEI